MTSGLLLAGGGSRGLLTAAYLKAFRTLGLDYNFMYGSSAGTLCGLLYHAGEDQKLEDLWLNIKTKDVYNKGPWDYLTAYKSKHIYDSRPLRKTIEKNVNYEALKANPRAFWINTTDLTNACAYSRNVRSFADKEDLVTFAFASASPPIYFPTVKFYKRELCDSGVVNNYSISEAIGMDCDTLILMLPAKPSPPTEAKNILELLGQVLGLSMQSYMEREAKAVNKINKILDTIHSAIEKSKCSAVLDDKDFPKKIKLIIIYPEMASTFGFLDFDYKDIDRQKLLDYGFNRAKSILEAEYDQPK